MPTPTWKDLLSTFDTGKPSSPSAEQTGGRGVIFTDTARLAEKFRQGREAILAEIRRFIDVSATFHHKWMLLDAGDGNFRRMPDDESWQSYHLLLSATLKAMQEGTDFTTSVFIIGGNDVIPMPELPALEKMVYLVNEEERERLRNYQADLLYCFPPGFDLKETLRKLYYGPEYDPDAELRRLMDRAACNVARLPFAEGRIERSFEETTGFYFKKVTEARGTIKVDNVLMTSAAQWLKESTDMTQGLPLLPIHEDPAYSYNGFYKSPTLSTETGDGMVFYKNSLRRADYMLFNLHGSYVNGRSGYSGGDTMGASYTAFDIPLLEDCNASVLSSTACFGAKFMNCDFTDSLLLASMYDSGILLFTGASHFAYGSILANDHYGASEIMMKIFTTFILSGMPAGEAMLLTKLKYFIAYAPYEDMDMGYLTICEFNLFGDPMTSCGNRKAEYDSVDSMISWQVVEPGRRRESLEDVYQRVRNLVDSNLDDIEGRLSRRLSEDYAFANLELRETQRRTNRGVPVGYVFTYNYGRGGLVIANTDTEGNITSAYYTK